MRPLLVTLSVVFILSNLNSTCVYAKENHAWLEPMNPSKLEWLALQKQADEGDTEFGENGLTVNFYLGEKSYESGVIYCDIDYLPGTSAEIVQRVEEGIRARFQRLAKSKSPFPWAKVEITKKVLR